MEVKSEFWMAASVMDSVWVVEEFLNLSQSNEKGLGMEIIYSCSLHDFYVLDLLAALVVLIFLMDILAQCWMITFNENRMF